MHIPGFLYALRANFRLYFRSIYVRNRNGHCRSANDSCCVFVSVCATDESGPTDRNCSYHIYPISILTGALSDIVFKVGNVPSALIAGIIAPVIYCLIYSLVVSRFRNLEETGGNVQRRRISRSWYPIIIAALIQAVATILAAVLTIIYK